MKQSAIATLDDFDGVLREIALIDATVTGADVDRQNDIITAEGTFAARTKTLTDRRALLAEQLQLFYRANRKEIEGPKKKKSIELRFGSAGIKISAPSLRTLKGWTWEKVLTAIRGPERSRFVRSKETVDKAALKAAKLPDHELALIGVKVHQSETFWFETKPAATKEPA